MLDFRELQGLEVSEHELSQSGKKMFSEIVQVAKTLNVNPEDPQIELAAIGKILSLKAKKDRLRNEAELLSINQEVCKDSLILLTSIEELMPITQNLDLSNDSKIFIKEVEEFKSKVDSHTNLNYDESIDHINLIKLSQDIDDLIKEVDKLQEKNELFGDFPTVKNK